MQIVLIKALGLFNMEIIGYGEARPVTPNTNPDSSDTPEGKQKNRRVKIIIKKGK